MKREDVPDVVGAVGSTVWVGRESLIEEISWRLEDEEFVRRRERWKWLFQANGGPKCGGREGKGGNVLHFGHVEIEVLLEHPSSDAQGGKSC